MFESRTTTCHRVDDQVVVARVDHDGNVVVILRCRPNHRRSTDIDVFNHRSRGRTTRNGGGKRIQVHDNEIEWLDTQLRQLIDVRVVSAVGEDATVNGGVKSFDTAVKRFGKARHLAHLGDIDTRVANRLTGRPG